MTKPSWMSSSEDPVYSSVQLNNLPVEETAKNIVESFPDIDLESEEFASAQSLEAFGLDHLKSELSRRGLKTGGTLVESEYKIDYKIDTDTHKSLIFIHSLLPLQGPVVCSLQEGYYKMKYVPRSSRKERKETNNC
jgi:Replication stress response SDE2 C-terminal